MNDMLYSPVLEFVMVPKNTYDNIFSFVESHDDYTTYIPDVKFVDYDKSFDLMTQFIEDAIAAIDQNNYTSDDISIATQKFIMETDELWPLKSIYHNRILKFMESAYMIPERAKNLRNKLVADNPSQADAITYMTRKYLESYMDHVIKEIDYIDNYINGNDIAPLQENSLSNFKGYYLSENLGSQIAAIPGMIMALIKKLMNNLSLSLSEASRKFASRILTDNQINENAIKEIYKLYQAKGRANSQIQIKYPDPQQVHQLRQAFGTGFKAFSDQMIKAIDTDNFNAVDQGVVKMVSNFRVVSSNKTLPISASYQEFRTAILSIANNILMMDDFMKSLVQIDDAIAQKYNYDPAKIKKELGVLDKQTQINKEVSQTKNESVSSDDIFDSMFETVGNVSNNTKNSVTNTTENSNDKKEQKKMDKNETNAKVKEANAENYDRMMYGLRTAPLKGIANFTNDGLPKIIEDIISQYFGEFIGNKVIPNVINLISSMIGDSANESVEYDDIINMFEDDQSSLQQNPSTNTSSISSNDETIDASDIGVNPDGNINTNVFSIEFLKSIISKLKLDVMVDKIKQTIISLVEKYILARANGSKSNDTTNTSKNANTNQQTNESYIDDFFVEAGFVQNATDTIRGAVAAVIGKQFFKQSKKKISDNVNYLANANPQNMAETIKTISLSICGRLKLAIAFGRIERYVLMQQNGKDGIKAFREDKDLHSTLGILATIIAGVTGVVIIQMTVNKNPIEAIKQSIGNFRSNKVPQPKRATENIANTRQAVPNLVQDLWNKVDKPIKNLYMFVNGWLYGGQSIKGSNEKTVGLAEIIRQEIESLAPYVNMTDVIQFNTEQKL